MIVISQGTLAVEWVSDFGPRILRSLRSAMRKAPCAQPLKVHAKIPAIEVGVLATSEPAVSDDSCRS